MDDQNQDPRQAGGGQQESGAGYGNAQESGAQESGAQQGGAQQGGGMDSSGGTGSDGGTTSGAVTETSAGSNAEDADQVVHRSETIEAEDIAFEADDDLIDDDE